MSLCNHAHLAVLICWDIKGNKIVSLFFNSTTKAAFSNCKSSRKNGGAVCTIIFFYSFDGENDQSFGINVNKSFGYEIGSRFFVTIITDHDAELTVQQRKIAGKFFSLKVHSKCWSIKIREDLQKGELFIFAHFEVHKRGFIFPLAWPCAASVQLGVLHCFACFFVSSKLTDWNASNGDDTHFNVCGFFLSLREIWILTVVVFLTFVRRARLIRESAHHTIKFCTKSAFSRRRSKASMMMMIPITKKWERNSINETICQPKS